MYLYQQNGILLRPFFFLPRPEARKRPKDGSEQLNKSMKIFLEENPLCYRIERQ